MLTDRHNSTGQFSENSIIQHIIPKHSLRILTKNCSSGLCPAKKGIELDDAAGLRYLCEKIRKP